MAVFDMPKRLHSFSYSHSRLSEIYVSITVLAIKNEEIIFTELGFILCEVQQPLLMKNVLKYFLEVKAVAIRKKPFNDQSNVADFHLWSLLSLGNPKSTET